MCPAERWRMKELQKENPMLTAGERVVLDDAQMLREVSGANHRASKGPQGSSAHPESRVRPLKQKCTAGTLDTVWPINESRVWSGDS